MSEHTVVDLVGGLQGRCPPATTTDELLCVVFGGHAELQPTNTRRMKIMFIGWPPFYTPGVLCRFSFLFLHSIARRGAPPGVWRKPRRSPIRVRTIL